MDQGKLGIVLGFIGLIFSIVGWFDPVAKISNLWSKTSTNRTRRRITELEEDLASVRRFSQNPQLLIVFLLRLILIVLGASPIIIISMVLTQTSSSSLIQALDTVLGIVAYIAIMFTVTMGTRLARRIARFSEYESNTTASLTELRAKLPQPARPARTRRR